MPERNKQGDDPTKGPPQKKVKVVEKPIRQRYTVGVKNHARELKKEGKQAYEITEILKKEYDVDVKSSTLATWYNPRNMKTHGQRGSLNTCMASVETHDNPTQRPSIVIDTEYALKANNIGSDTDNDTLKRMALGIFKNLRALNIYDGPGERRRLLSELTEDEINTLLANAGKDRFVCPICQAPVTSGSHYNLLLHLQDDHRIPNDEQIGSPPGGKEFTFKGSSTWASNFRVRHSIHKVLTGGDKQCNVEVENQNDEADVRESASSAAAAASPTRHLDLSKATSYVDANGNEVFLSRFTALNQSATSSTTGRTSPESTCSSLHLRLSSEDNSTSGDGIINWTNNNLNKLSDFDLYKQSDVDNFSNVELDKQSDIEPAKQCNVEVDIQSYGELDIDCIRTSPTAASPSVSSGDISTSGDGFVINNIFKKLMELELYEQSDIEPAKQCNVEVDNQNYGELDISFSGDGCEICEINNISKKLMEFELNEQSDVELDKQCNVEVDNQNDGELDIDYIRTQLYSLPCVPGGECSCDTDFTSQIPEDILNFFNMMPDNDIIIVDQDKYVYI